MGPSRSSRIFRPGRWPCSGLASVAGLFGLLGVTFLPACSREKAPGGLTVAAASDLVGAFHDVGEAFSREAGQAPAFTFGSTGLLAKQIHEGAPFDVLASANVEYVDRVIRSGDCDGATKAVYGRGRIVMWVVKGAPLPGSLSDLSAPRFRKIAIANPEHAPYGRAAREALERGGVWAAVESRVVYGENVQQTLQFARSGNADVALVALSLALAAKDGEFLPVSEERYAPMDQALVVCRHGKNFDAGRKFASFVSSPEGREIMKRHGFLLPGEVMARSP